MIHIGQLTLSEQELRDAVALLEKLPSEEGRNEAVLYFCCEHTPAFADFETGFDQHMREVHNAPEWRQDVIGATENE
jgi:hypothetical protein